MMNLHNNSNPTTTMKKQNAKLKTNLLAAALLFTAALNLHAQGSLTPPPGAPTPTMKSLDQIEPRTPINASTTPGNINHTYIISQPGSYYLEGNLAVTNNNGIYVSTNNVTIDLRGFTISRSSGASGAAILLAPVANPAILNGTLRGFSTAMDGQSATGGQVRAVCATGFGLAGFNAGAGWRFTECSAQLATNGGIMFGFSTSSNASFQLCKVWRVVGTSSTSFSAGSRSSFNLCSANENTATTEGFSGFTAGAESSFNSCEANGNRFVTGGFGFNVTRNTLLRNCIANDNDATSGTSSSGGFWTDENVSLIDCHAGGNYGNNPTTPGRGGVGFYVYGSGLVQNCTASGNSGDGIHVYNGSSGIKILNCLVANNTLSGIHVLTGLRNVIENNHVKGNGIGVEITTSGNLIIGNTAAGNTNNYSIAGSNRYGPIVDLTANGAAAASGNSAASTMSTTDPRANIAF